MKTPKKFGRTSKNCTRFIYGIMAILIISCSIIAYNIPLINPSPVSNTAPLSPLMKQSTNIQIQSNPLLDRLSEDELRQLGEFKEYLTEYSGVDQEALELFDQNLGPQQSPEEYSRKINDYFTDQWVPQESTFNLSSDEVPNFEDSLKSVFFNDWLKKPSYSLLDENGNEVQSDISQYDQRIESVKSVHMDGYELIDKSIITPNQEITERSIISEDFYTTEVTETRGKPRITLQQSDFSGLNRFQVPILSQDEVNAGEGASSAEDVEWLNQTLDIKTGFAFDTPEWMQWRKEWGIYGIVKFKAWAVFDFSFHFVFPIRLIIEYPAEVVEGGHYRLKVTLQPLDITDYNEFEFKIEVSVGCSLVVLGITIVHVPIIFFYFELNESYITPLGSEYIAIDLGYDFDFIEFLADKEIPYVSAACKVLQYVVRCGLGLGLFVIKGDSVSGLLEASTGGSIASSLDVNWKHAGDSKTLEFWIPQSGEENSYLDLAVSKIVYHASDVFWIPTFYIGLKNIAIFPLQDWFGEYRRAIAWISLFELHLPAIEDYPPIIQTATVAPTADYDFSMEVTEISPTRGQGTFTGVTTYTQMYNISLSNLADRTDYIELGVQDLPEGYRVSFDSVTPQISGTPSTVYLIIDPPEHIKAPPGERPFHITATSLGRRNTGLENDTVIENATLTVPELVDLNLELDLHYNPAEIIQVAPDMSFPIKFYGGNLGNLDDNITVTTTIYNEETTLRTWESNYSIDPYGVGLDQFYSGEVTFTYSKDDLFPTPGLYTLDITATSQRWPTIVRTQSRVLNFTSYYDFETSIDPNITTMFANFDTNFIYTIKNMGNDIENFTLSSSGWDDYLSYSSKILNVEPNETREVIINLTVDDPNLLPPALYDFRITAIPDSSDGTVFSVDIVSVNVLAPEYVAPAITLIPQYLGTRELIFPQSPLTLSLVWKAFDLYPQTYYVYIDDVIYNTNTWENNTPIFVPVTGTNPLSIGDHNITITFSDVSNNVAIDQIWVKIEPTDGTQPSIVPIVSSLTIPQNFWYSQYLIWNCTEEFLLNATIYRNDSEISINDLFIEQKIGETSTFRTKGIIRPGSLPEGVWNFTAIIQDMSDNSVSSTIIVIVTPIDSDPPQITSPPNSSALFRYSETLTFSATDAHPDNFELWINGNLEHNNRWLSGIPVNFNIDDLNLLVGSNDLELYLYDLSGQYIYHQWTFTLQDVDPPTFLVEPSNFTVNEHEISVTDIPYWYIHDNDPHLGIYQIYRDGVLVKENTWAIGNRKVSVPIETLTSGIYEYYAIFRDATGNSLFSTLFVTINDVLSPFIWPHDPIRYEPLYTASWFELFITETHLVSYLLYLNDVLINQGTFSENFPFLLVDLSDLPTGQHIYKLEVLDQSGNIGEEFIQVRVTDYIPPFIKKPPDLFYSEGTTGHKITWVILEANPRNYSLYLNSELIESGTSIGENLTISVDSLALGIYEYLLVVYDDQGFSHSASCSIAVVDITPPSITHISDCRFSVGDPNSKVIWEVYDLHPASYIIKRNGVALRPLEEWAGEDIILFFVGWTPGSHEIEVVVSDTSGNIVIDTFVVTLVEVEEVSTISKPGVSPGFSFTLVLGIIIIFSRIQRKKEEQS